jgi:hypothetical protein
MLKLRDNDALQEYVALAPITEQVMLQVVGALPDSIARDITDDARAMPGWSVFKDDAGRGLALNLHYKNNVLTPLQRRFNLFQQTLVVAGAVKALRIGEDLHLCDCEDLPPDWVLFRLDMDKKVIWCAVSRTPPRLSLDESRSSIQDAMVTLPLTAECGWHGAAMVGESQVINILSVALGQGDVTGVLYRGVGGGMTIRVEELDNSERKVGDEFLPVRIDLGEVRLSLEQLVAVRRGMQLSLDTELPLRCYMRVGATTLAEAILEPDSTGMRLTIVDVCDTDASGRMRAASPHEATFSRVVSNS